MVCLSGPEEASVVLEDLKEVLYFGPGTLLFIRGGEMYHAILGGKWQKADGVRVSIVHFSHGSVWDKMGLEFDWSSDAISL